jgi:hypothetical protein
MYQLADLSLSDDEKLDMATPIAMPDRPEYSYGTRICLTESELTKLGIDPSEATVGGYFMLHALCCVTSVSKNETEAGDCYRVEAQIEQAAVDGDDSEVPTDAPATAAPKGFYKSMRA